MFHRVVCDVLFSLQAPLYWDIYVPLGLDSARLAFTCHNFEYQGAEAAGAITACGLSAKDLMRPDRMQDNSFHNKINLLKVSVDGSRG